MTRSLEWSARVSFRKSIRETLHELSGEHTFTRFNPAAGVTYSLRGGVRALRQK